MSFTLSPIIADIVLQDLEEEALNIIGLNLPFYYRYVDDRISRINKQSDIYFEHF